MTCKKGGQRGGGGTANEGSTPIHKLQAVGVGMGDLWESVPTANSDIHLDGRWGVIVVNPPKKNAFPKKIFHHPSLGSQSSEDCCFSPTIDHVGPIGTSKK